MSRNNPSADPNASFLSTGVPVSGYPFTMSVWARQSADASIHTAIGFGSNNVGYFALGQINSGGGRAFLETQGSIVDDAFSAIVAGDGGSLDGQGRARTGVWNHIAATCDLIDRRCYLNGVGGSHVTNSNSFPAVAYTDMLGCRLSSATTTTSNFTGDVADGAVWNVVLDADEVSSLSAGVSPLLIRPSALVFYAPFRLGASILSGEPDLMSTRVLTPGISGSSIADNPSILQPAGQHRSKTLGSGPIIITTAIGETVTLGDTATRGSLSRARSGADTTTIADATSRASARSRAAADTTTVSDAASRTSTRARVASDTDVIADAVVRAPTRVRSASETATVGDSISRSELKSRAGTDTDVVADTASTGGAQTQSVGETATVVDALARSQTRSKNTADVTAIGDTITSSPSRGLVVAHTDVIADTVTMSSAPARGVGESVTLADVLARMRATSRGAADAVTIGNAVALSAAKRASAEMASVLDSLGVHVPHSLTAVAESVSISDSIAFAVVRVLGDPVLIRARVRSVVDMRIIARVDAEITARVRDAVTIRAVLRS